MLGLDTISGAGTAIWAYIFGDDGEKYGVAFEKVTGISSKVLPDRQRIDLPIFRLSPYDIFADSDGLFSVNIFDKQNTDSFISKVRTVVAGWYRCASTNRQSNSGEC